MKIELTTQELVKILSDINKCNVELKIIARNEVMDTSGKYMEISIINKRNQNQDEIEIIGSEDWIGYHINSKKGRS